MKYFLNLFNQYVGTDKMFLLPLKNRSSTGMTFQGQSLLNELGLLLHLTLLHLNFDLNLQGLVMHLFSLFSLIFHTTGNGTGSWSTLSITKIT